MNNGQMPKYILKGRMLVRDKDGRPKFRDPKLIKEFMHRLSEDDINYLKEKYGDNFCIDDSRS